MEEKKRTVTIASAYLILKKENKILLQLRQNTGYCDGMWSLVAGHVEDNEPASQAILREVKEEVGLDLRSSQIEIVHIMHRKSNRFSMDVFFHCSEWQGDVINMEPHKCADIGFFPIDQLPINTVEYHKEVLRLIPNNQFYSEFGWDNALSLQS